MPKIPERWKRRRSRKLRHVQYDALQKIGLSTAGSPLSGETALCIAYMCPYAYMCPSASFKPALVSQRDCFLRYPIEMRPASGLSEHAIDTLAAQRRDGRKLTAATLAVLDQFRPEGPSQSFGLKRPPRPIYPDAPVQPPRPARPSRPSGPPARPVPRGFGKVNKARLVRAIKRNTRVHVASKGA